MYNLKFTLECDADGLILTIRAIDQDGTTNTLTSRVTRPIELYDESLYLINRLAQSAAMAFRRNRRNRQIGQPHVNGRASIELQVSQRELLRIKATAVRAKFSMVVEPAG